MKELNIKDKKYKDCCNIIKKDVYLKKSIKYKKCIFAKQLIYSLIAYFIYKLSNL